MALLAIAALGFLLVPHERDAHLSGIWYTIGWPLPTASIKVGYAKFPGLFGIYPSFDITNLYNPVAWAALLCGFWRYSHAWPCSATAIRAMRVVPFLVVCASAVWLVHGLLSVRADFLHR